MTDNAEENYRDYTVFERESGYLANPNKIKETTKKQIYRMANLDLSREYDGGGETPQKLLNFTRELRRYHEEFYTDLEITEENHKDLKEAAQDILLICALNETELDLDLVVKEALRMGADVNKPITIDDYNRVLDGYDEISEKECKNKTSTILTKAINDYAHPNVIDLLIENGAIMSGEDFDGDNLSTALKSRTKHGPNEEEVKKIVDKYEIKIDEEEEPKAETSEPNNSNISAPKPKF